MRASSRDSAAVASSKFFRASVWNCVASVRNCSKVMSLGAGGWNEEAAAVLGILHRRRVASTRTDQLRSVQRRARLVGQRGKCRRIMDGEIREDLTVDLDTGFPQAVHELAVAQIILVGARVDAG